MIEVDRLGKSFGDTWVFRGVSFKVPQGGSLAIVGPSGSGKSVLLKILSGLLLPDEGATRLSSPEFAKVFQKNALFDSLTVLENLLLPLRERQGLIGPEARKRSLALLEQVGLERSADLHPSEISGGMQKRLGIARALVLRPAILLYDEPTAGLDPITSKKIADLILETRRSTGGTLICVTNDVHRAGQIGDRIGLLALGRYKDGGTPEQARRSRDPELRQFMRGLKEGPLSLFAEAVEGGVE